MPHFISRPIVASGLVLYYDAAAPKSYTGTGTLVKDLSGNNNTGTLTGGVGYASTGINSSFTFDGVDDYILVPYSSLLNFCTSSSDLPFTFSVWAFRGNATKDYYILNKGDNGNGTQEEYAMAILSDGKPFAIIYDTSGPNAVTVKGTTIIPIQTYTHIVTSYSGSGGSSGLKLYVNGIQETTVTGAGGTYVRMRPQSTNLYLGSFGTTGFYKAPYYGNIPIVQIYNRALTASEVLQNFNAQRSRFSI